MKHFLILVIFILIKNSAINAQTKIIAEGDNWQYYDSKVLPEENWTIEPSPTKEWKIGPSPLGYGDSAVTTTIDYGASKKNKHIVAYFKKSFNLNDPYQFLAYELNLQMDDGAIVYLNGREITRQNMPLGAVTDTTKALSLIVDGKTESFFYKTLLLPEDFQPGLNVISASVHQGRKSSVDCIFNLELIGSNDQNYISSLLKERTLKNLKLDFRINELEYKLSLEKKSIQIEHTKQLKDYYKYALYIVTLLFFTVLILSLIFFLNKNKKISNLDDKLRQFQNLNIDKNQELISYSLAAMQQKKLLKDTKESIKDISLSEIPLQKKQLNKIIKQLDFHIVNEDEWQRLLNHFNNTYKGYLDHLKQHYPTLTDTELRHCIFIRLHMQTKEIAKILNIDPRSVQAARYRIKKKMNLDESIDLKDYLQKF